MSIPIALPHQLRPLAGGRDQITITVPSSVKPTLRETIDAINLECPGIRERLIGADGKLRRFVTLYIDNTDCRTLADERHARKLKDPATPPEEAKKEPDPLDLVLTGFEEIAILPAIAGG